MLTLFFRYLALLITVISIVGLTAFYNIDDEFAKRLVDRLAAYNRQLPTEKVYVQTDRDSYLAGETVWLKGYLVEGSNHQADTVSRVLYIDIIGPADRGPNSRVRTRAQLRATSGYAPGQLTLPDSLPAGTYLLQAYTNYMRNFPEEYYFKKTLAVLRSNGSVSEQPVQTSTRPDVQFLPEGGQLVTGLDSRVAFKAVSPSGQGVDVEGFVLDAKKDTITGFASTHLGMGYFALKPEAGQNYTAFVRLGDGSYTSYPLPTVQAQGYIMQVDNLTNKDNVRVFVRSNKPEATTGQITVVAQTRGQIVHVAKAPAGRKAVQVQLARADFPEGISQITLFDETNTPVCERLVFVTRNEQLTVRLTPSRTTYKKREKVELTITTADAQGNPVAANLSLAATDAQLAPEADSNSATIVSYLLLSSDLPGTIEQPGHYFNPTHKSRLPHLDLLLLTQGWRRFTWPEILGEAAPSIKYPIEQGLSLTGKVIRPNQKASGKVRLTFMLMKRDSTRDMLTGETDEAGNYAAYDLDFTDTTNVLIQAIAGRNNRNLNLTLDQLLTPTVMVTKIPYNPLMFRREELTEFVKRTDDYLEIERQIRRNREVLLKEVQVKARRNQAPDSRKIYGTADATVKFDPINTSGRLTILDVIQGRVAGVQVIGTGFNASVQIRGAANFQGVIEPLFVLDGMPVDKQTVLSLSVQDVDQVDVLKGASAGIYGSRAAGGVISILTKRGSPNYDYMKETTPGVLVAKLPGYTPVREFYAPCYDVAKPDYVRPDYRATLHWAPMIQTDATGKATVFFYTSDAKTILRLRAEAATPTGLLGMNQTVLKVD